MRSRFGSKLPLGIGAVVVLQLLFTYAPPLQALFDNEAIPLWVWPLLVLGGVVFFLVVEAEKLVIRSSEPQKSSLIACTDGGAARILQIKEPLNNQQNDVADQLLYIVASPSTVRVRDQTYQVNNGWFALIPRGVTYSIARAGRNPVMAMMIRTAEKFKVQG